jgi:hypothetical protein
LRDIGCANAACPPALTAAAMQALVVGALDALRACSGRG